MTNENKKLRHNNALLVEFSNQIIKINKELRNDNDKLKQEIIFLKEKVKKRDDLISKYQERLDELTQSDSDLDYDYYGHNHYDYL